MRGRIRYDLVWMSEWLRILGFMDVMAVVGIVVLLATANFWDLSWELRTLNITCYASPWYISTLWQIKVLHWLSCLHVRKSLVGTGLLGMSCHLAILVERYYLWTVRVIGVALKTQLHLLTNRLLIEMLYWASFMQYLVLLNMTSIRGLTGIWSCLALSHTTIFSIRRVVFDNIMSNTTTQLQRSI